MPFHVEIRASTFQRARAFNLDEARLRRDVLEPWVRGLRVTVGERQWEPRECTLRILEGPTLSAADLNLGQGWNRAERTGRDATRALIDGSAIPRPQSGVSGPPAPSRNGAVAVVAETLAGARRMAALLQERGLATVEWATVRDGVLGGQNGLVSAAVLLLEGDAPSGAWLFDAGLAAGAVGRRAVLVRTMAAPIPPELNGVTALEAGADAAEVALRLAAP